MSRTKRREKPAIDWSNVKLEAELERYWMPAPPGFDEAYLWKLPPEETVIEVEMSRPLTWAEREDFLRWYPRADFMSPRRVAVSSKKTGSRPLFAAVTKTLETKYVNVYPRAVLTVSEKEQ